MRRHFSRRDGLTRWLLQDLYGLTPAEADLAEGLANGSRLEDLAEYRHVRISTIRTQLKSVLEKTGATRQAELVRLTGLLGQI